MTAIDAAFLLLTQAWQLAALVVVISLATRLLARRRPHLAHALWLVVLLKCLTPPVWSSPSGLFCRLQPAAKGIVADRVGAANGFSSADGTKEGTAELRAMQSDARGSADTLGERSRNAISAQPARPHSTTAAGPDAIPPAQANDIAGRSVGIPWAFASAVLAVWLAGAAMLLAVTLSRFWTFSRQLKGTFTYQDDELNACARRLSARFGMRRPVPVRVTMGSTGPSVFGLSRPRIVLPHVLVAGKSAVELEPILAHELLHVRRGDLWVGLLQTIARSLWWFHPLVWYAARQWSREAEHCCDEEVLAELQCEPSRYARSLLEVLDRKLMLRTVPAFPGVRPVEITSQRLERIMMIRQKHQRRTPGWCWWVMVVVALLTLPGRAFVAAENEEPRADSQKPKIEQVRSPQTADAAPEPLVTRVYDVADLVLPGTGAVHGGRRLTTGNGTPGAVLVQFDPLIDFICATVDPDSWTTSGGKSTIDSFPVTLSLVVRQSVANHDLIDETLLKLRSRRSRQIAIEVQTVTATSAAKQDSRFQEFVSGAPKTLPRDAVPTLLATLEDVAGIKIESLSHVTLDNGEGIELFHVFRGSDVQRGAPLRLASRYRFGRTPEAIEVCVAWNVTNAFEAMSAGELYDIPDGHTLLIDMTRSVDVASRKTGIPFTDTSDLLERVNQIPAAPVERGAALLLLTPRIVVPD